MEEIYAAENIAACGQGANVFIANPDGSNVQQVPLVNMAEDFGIPAGLGNAPICAVSKQG